MAVLIPLADHSSFGFSMLFLGPVFLLLLTLVVMSVRERRRRERGGG